MQKVVDETNDVLSVTARPWTSTEWIGIAVVISALYLFREVFVPIASAVLLGFILAPIVGLFQKVGVGRVPAVLIAVGIAFSVIISLGVVITMQISALAENLPRYEFTIRDKITTIREATVERGAVKKAAETIKDIGKGIELDKERAAPAQVEPDSKDKPKPLSVEVHQPDPTTFESLERMAAPLLSPFFALGVTIIFVIFVLLQQDDLRNRFIRLGGASDLQRTTIAIDDAARRLSRFLLSQAIVNCAFAFFVALGLWLIGIPSAILWGLLAGAFRFVPYVGTVLAAIIPIGLAAAVDPGWSSVLLTSALYFLIEPIVAYAIEPAVYGNRVGLSPVAIVVSAAFWTTLWGPIGLLLSTPLTMCLVVAGRNSQSLRFLDVLLSDKPALTAPQIFYQRMLAGDPEEALQEAEEALEASSFTAYCDQVVLPAIQAAQVDVWRGVTRAEQLETIKQSFDAFLVEASQLAPSTERPPTSDDGNVSGAPVIACLAGTSALDTPASAMLCAVFVAEHLRAHTALSKILNAIGSDSLEPGVSLVCISYLDVTSPARLRYAVRRLRRKAATVQILVCCWMLSDDLAEDLRISVGADFVATKLSDAVEMCRGPSQRRADAARSIQDAGPSSL